MKLITDKDLRNAIFARMEKSREETPELPSLDELEEIIKENQKESRTRIRDHYSTDLSIVYTGIMSLGLSSIGFEMVDEDIIKEWPDDRKNNGNFLLGCLLRQLSNSSLAITRLVEDGLDYQGRILFKSLCELSWMTLVIVSDTNLMGLYAQELDYSKEKEIWSEFFTADKLIEKLSLIEKELGFSDSLAENLGRIKMGIYEFHTKISNHSYPSCTIGSFSKPVDAGDNFVPNFYGIDSTFSGLTLQRLNECLFYFINVFWKSLESKHGFSLKEGIATSDSVEILNNNFITAYLYKAIKDKLDEHQLNIEL